MSAEWSDREGEMVVFSWSSLILGELGTAAIEAIVMIKRSNQRRKKGP